LIVVGIVKIGRILINQLLPHIVRGCYYPVGTVLRADVLQVLEQSVTLFKYAVHIDSLTVVHAVDHAQVGHEFLIVEARVIEEALQAVEVAVLPHVLKQVGEETVPEPDWLAGGTGSMEDLTASHSLMITEQYIQRYENYDLGITTNCTFDAVMDGNESIQGFIRLSPGKSGYGLKDKYVDHIYEYTTPMLAKAFYYGVGPGSSVLDNIIEETRGNRDGIEEIRLIITHVAASQVYAKLHDADPSMGTSKTAYDAGLRKVKVFVKGPGAGRESAIRTINNAGIVVTEIVDVTPMPHNGCRPKGRRKV
jgi:hypothetical protein